MQLYRKRYELLQLILPHFKPYAFRLFLLQYRKRYELLQLVYGSF